MTTPHNPQSQGVDRSTYSLFALAALGNLAMWWLRQHIGFELLAPLTASVLLIMNAWIAWTFARREPIVGYILGGAAVIVQLGFIILFEMAYRSPYL